ncbi:group II intron reverse transcriptase domain-containing protein [Candidatus Uhrbacteria bacterium]|nr:group II intron reverse transcriptase domain-containing protein [Candidatus Uhrbacteria bacterium]
MKIQLSHGFEKIISVENLLDAWKEFVRGKRNKIDVQNFSLDLMSNIFSLRDELVGLTYKHGGYEAFNICDPKPRNIHKAAVRDRLLHHAIYRILYPFFDKVFISESFSCRLDKGTHRAINKFRSFFCKISCNNTRTCWVLKCDIRRFFASIDHAILMNILRQYIPDADTLWLIQEVVASFSTVRPDVGLPVGNLTSQLLVNIYMNEFDQFMKHKLKVKRYIRYADDFVILSDSRVWLEDILPSVESFLKDRLKLDLHPNKVFIKTIASGVDFLGWVSFPNHLVLRSTSRRQMMKKINHVASSETINSYFGLVSHGAGYKLKKRLAEKIIFN